MKFCPNCQRALVRDTSSGEVKFACAVCGTVAAGGPHDVRIMGAVLGAGETTEMYRKLIQNASFDRTNQQVAKTCAACGLTYMTQIRVGESESIVFTCKCGVILTGEAAASHAGKSSASDERKK